MGGRRVRVAGAGAGGRAGAAGSGHPRGAARGRRDDRVAEDRGVHPRRGSRRARGHERGRAGCVVPRRAGTARAHPRAAGHAGWGALGALKPTAISAASMVAPHETRNGALTPPGPITAPASAEPAARPPIRAAETQVNASVSLPAVTARPTRAYWQENIGAMVRPASRLPTTPAGIERAAISGAVHSTARPSNTR